MEMYDNLHGIIPDDPTPPLTPSLNSEEPVDDSVTLEEDPDEGVEEDISDGTETIETRSSSDDPWKPGLSFGGDTSSVNTEDSFDTSSSVRRRREARGERGGSGKRVTFAKDDLLVRVIFIPFDTGPCLEELTPCDPDALVDDISEMTIEGYAASNTPRSGTPAAHKSPPPQRAPSRQSSDSPGGVGTPVVAGAPTMIRFGRGFLGAGPAVGKYGTPSMKALGRGLCLQGRPVATSPKPATRKRPNTANEKQLDPVADIKNADGISQTLDAAENTTRKNTKQARVQSPRRNIRSANAFAGRRRLLPPTPEERLQPLFVHTNRKIRSAAWSGKNPEALKKTDTGELLTGNLQTRRLKGITSRSTSSLHRIKSMEDLKSNLNRARSISCDNVKTMSSNGGTTPEACPSPSPAAARLMPSSGFGNKKYHTGRRSVTRRSLPVRPDHQMDSTMVIDERLSPLMNAACASPPPRVHQSPYRQSSLPPLGQRSVTFVEPGVSAALGRDRSGSAQSDLSTSSGHVHAMKHMNTPIATRKLYAWHMANGNLGANAHLETPCISPLWDYLPKASDPPVQAAPYS